MTRIAIDPVTRVGGHLRIEAEVTNGVVTDAWSSGTMFRGIELILRGRDARDAWLLAQRVCGTCTGVHALASVRAVEDAIGVTIPRNARLIRNILAGSQLVQDHVVSFYHRHALDWVDLPAGLSADPVATSAFARSVSERPLSNPSYFKNAQDRLARFIDSGQPGPFANGYWSHPAITLPPEASLMVLAHYLEALDLQRRTTRIGALLGGKNPHPQTFLVGGMALSPPWGGPKHSMAGEHPQQLERTPEALGARGLSDLGDLMTQLRTFVEQVYVPDVLAIAGHYVDWAGIGRGLGSYLSFGDLPEDDASQPALLLPSGRVVDADLTKVAMVDQAGIAETVAHSHYSYDGDDDALRPPAEGRTEPRYAGPKAPVISLEGSAKYSWLKAPRYQGQPMEVGPLARLLVGYAAGPGDARARVDGVVARLGIGPDALLSTLGRTVARAIEAQVVAGRLGGWIGDLTANLATGDLAIADVAAWDPATWPRAAQGWALGEGPRGAVGHWIRIVDGRIADYQIVDASTWNASPRDAKGGRGPLEEALVGTPVADPARPVEILRTVRSFDPCPACAVHLLGAGPGVRVDLRLLEGAVR